MESSQSVVGLGGADYFGFLCFNDWIWGWGCILLLVLLYIIFLELAREKEKLLIITQQFHYYNLSFKLSFNSIILR